MKKIFTQRGFRIMFWGWVIFITCLSLTPGSYIPPPPFEITRPDVVAHFVFYLFFTMSGIGAFRTETSKLVSFFLIIFSISTGYGWLIEIVQYFIPGRYFDWSDGIVNMAGGILGLIFSYLFLWKKQ